MTIIKCDKCGSTAMPCIPVECNITSPHNGDVSRVKRDVCVECANKMELQEKQDD